MIPRVDTITLQHDGHARTARLAVPPSGSCSALVVMLHGTGGNARYAAEETRWHEYAGPRQVAVLYPDGLPVDPANPPKFLTNPQRWNDGSAVPGEPFYSRVDDVGFLAALVEHVRASLNIDRGRVLLSGFSNGAGMTFRIAAERPELFAAIAPVAGYCAVAPMCGSVPTPTLYISGDADLLIPLHGGPVQLPWGNRVVQRTSVAERLGPWAVALGCDGKRTRIEEEPGVIATTYTGPVPFVHLTVAGLGHHWPGGRGAFNPRIAGPLSHRLDGCARVWRFFGECGSLLPHWH